MIIDIIQCDDYHAIYLNNKFHDYGEFYNFSDILLMGVEIGEKLEDGEGWDLFEHEVDWEWLHDLDGADWPEDIKDVEVL